jgi:hypothetical protein
MGEMSSTILTYAAKRSGLIYSGLQNGPVLWHSVIKVLFRYMLVYMVCISTGNISYGENAQYLSQ